jgi:two-component system phosphate regulon sensor histidine kinase PhoR
VASVIASPSDTLLVGLIHRERFLKELWFLFLVAVFAIGAILFGNLFLEAFAVFVLLVYSFFEVRQAEKLKQWLAAPFSRSPPSGYGKWGEIFGAVYRMTQAQHRMQERISRSLDRFQKGVAVFPDGLVLLDENYSIEWCNPAAENLLGVSLSKDVGQHIYFFIRQHAFREYLLQPKQTEPLTLKVQHLSDRILEIQALPFAERQMLLLIRDVSLVHQMASTQKEFVANVSHELRTPITVIIGFLEVLQESDRLGEVEQRSLTLMREQASRMQTLIEDLLALSRLEASDSKASYDTIDMSELLMLILAETKQLSANRHKITFNFEAKLALYGNRSEIHSAFSNLVSNAIRYTPAGGSIHLAWFKEGKEAVFMVQDTGIGIEPQHLPKLTERFYRVERSRSRETGGTGLGLAIVQQVALRHDAHLEVDSYPDKGSTFKMVFPEYRLACSKKESKKGTVPHESQVR